MSLLVDSPILNSPFDDPTRHWAYEEGQPVLKEGASTGGLLNALLHQGLKVSRGRALPLPGGSDLR